MRKINWHKLFTIDENTDIQCGSQDTRYGFRHLAILRSHGVRLAETKACYYNRTWERYEYASVIHSAIRKAFPKEADALIERVDNQALGRINDSFKMVAGIAKLGEILCDKPAEKNDWKARMLKAGLPGVELPDDWDQLGEEENGLRLDKAIASLA